jgi:hypothetical protein
MYVCVCVCVCVCLIASQKKKERKNMRRKKPRKALRHLRRARIRVCGNGRRVRHGTLTPSKTLLCWKTTMALWYGSPGFVVLQCQRHYTFQHFVTTDLSFNAEYGQHTKHTNELTQQNTNVCAHIQTCAHTHTNLRTHPPTTRKM